MIHHLIPSCIPIRWEVAILIFFGLVANYSLRLNLSIAIVEMSNSTSSDGTVITWSSEEKNYVLSAFFYGYVVMQVEIISTHENHCELFLDSWWSPGGDIRNKEGFWDQHARNHYSWSSHTTSCLL